MVSWPVWQANLAYFQENYGFAFGDSLQTMSFERYQAFFDSVDPSPFLAHPDA